MDTLVTVTVSSGSPKKAGEAIEEAFEEIRKLEALVSFWSPESEISAINRNAGVEAVKVSPDTIDMIEKALFVSKKTDGGFDPTIGPLIRLYDFKKKTRPSEALIREKLRPVGYKEMVIDKPASTAFLRKKGMSFDTGGIAKGYAAERASEALKRKGIKAGLVAVAGDIRAFGLRPDGKPWSVGIRNPRAEGKDDEIMAVVELRDDAVSTSGDYERSFIEGNKLYHHILDPKTGLPAPGCRSVTVVSGNGAYSDGFSTGIFVMGPEKGMALLKEMGFDGIIVGSDGKLHMTEGLKDRVRAGHEN